MTPCTGLCVSKLQSGKHASFSRVRTLVRRFVPPPHSQEQSDHAPLSQDADPQNPLLIEKFPSWAKNRANLPNGSRPKCTGSA